MVRRDDFDDFFGDEDETPVVDTRADGRLYRVPLGRLSANLVNPRKDFGTEDQLIDLGKSLGRRQNQPCPVVSRGAYLKLWPDHDTRIGDVDYVLVSGERRYRGANAVGLSALDCVANDDFAKDRRTFMEAVVSENVDRQNFDPIEEAYAVQALVAEFGSNRAVAQHFDRVDGWVTQRVLLTNLAREVQDLVRGKTIPLEAARQLGKLARDKEWTARDQLEWWEEEQERRATEAATRAAARKAARRPVVPEGAPSPVLEPRQPAHQKPPSFTAVKHDPDPHPEPETVPPPATPQPGQNPILNEPAEASQEGPQIDSVPEPRRTEASSEASQGKQPKTLPYGDPWFITMHLATKMTDLDFFKMVELVVETANDRDPDRLRSVLATVLANPAAQPG